MTGRRLLTSLCLVSVAVPLTLGTTGIAASAANGQGRFLTPFREDGAHYDPATNTFSGGFAKGAKTDANGCVIGSDKSTGAPKDNPDAYDCLPAGATMVQLPNGKVVFWNALEGEEAIKGTNSVLLDGGRLTVNDESRVLDTRGGKATYAKPSPVDAGAHQTEHPDDLPLGPLSAQHYSYNNGSMFCSDQVLLSDGNVIDVGGTDYYTEPYVPVANTGVVELQGVKNSRIFDAASQRWTLGPTMHYGRWYPALVTLGNGNLFVASGVQKLVKPVTPSNPADSGTNVKQSETLDLRAAKPAWKVNPASADKSLPLFPRFHLLTDGHVYYDAAGQDFNPFGQAYDEALWEVASSYDPKTATWSDLGVPGTDPGYLAANPTAAPYAGFRGSTFSAALTMRPSKVVGGVPEYTSNSYLTAGGVLGVSPGSYVAVANSRITTVDAEGGKESLTTTGTDPLNTARWYGTATPLPNGQVFVSSGANVDEVDLPGSESPIRTTELFTPTVDAAGHYTGGTWVNAGNQARKRTYHNNALLQPDGSVLIGGHAPIATGYFQTTDTPDLPGRDGTNNHHDASFQVWQPPYLNDPGRPVISGVDKSGHSLVVHTSSAAKIATVVLMRNTAQTHLVDADARTVSLPVLSRTADTVTVGVPTSSNVLPAGPYLLFANKSKTADLSGRNAADLLPSVGKQLFITGTSSASAYLPSALARKAAAKPAVAAGGPVATGGVSTAQARTVARPGGSSRTGLPAPKLALAADPQRDRGPGLPPALPVALVAVTGAGVLGRRWVRRTR
ncbi:MAG: kelch domain protein [Frankiales bacterium]|nr:kelch domain protein [Frankiales bacterium]